MTVLMCYRTGGAYTFRDAELLANQIKRNWSSSDPLTIIVLADQIGTKMDLINFSVVPPENRIWPGWWTKMNMFAPSLECYRPFLYIDLDTAIVGDLKEIMPEDPDQFITLEDFYHPKRLASGIMWIPAKSEVVSKIWRAWIGNVEGIIKKWRGDQEFIGSIVDADNYWQRIKGKKIISFKPKTGWLKELPKDTVVVCFHGKPKLWEAAKTVSWVKKYVNYENIH